MVSQFGFTKHQIKMIEVIVLLNAMALSILLPTAQSSGEIQTVDKQLIRFGTVTVTINAGQTSATTNTALFNFPAGSTFLNASVNPTTAPQTITTFGPGPVVYFISNPSGETWTSMPVGGPTELFSNINDQIQLDLSQYTNATFFVNCPTGSSSATSFLQPQFSTDAGNTWTDLASIAGSLDTPIDNTLVGPCGFGGPTNLVVAPTASISSSSRGSATILRTAGFNGNGIGDNPVFSQIGLQFFTIVDGYSESINCNVLNHTRCSITISMSFPAVVPRTIKVSWIALACASGFATC